MPISYKITIGKGAVKFLMGVAAAAVGGVVVFLQGYQLPPEYIEYAGIITVGVSLLTMLENYIKHRNDA